MSWQITKEVRVLNGLGPGTSSVGYFSGLNLLLHHQIDTFGLAVKLINEKVTHLAHFFLKYCLFCLSGLVIFLVFVANKRTWRFVWGDVRKLTVSTRPKRPTHDKARDTRL